MSGVKNLRAMFEQKNDTSNSPPDRGRSPGPGTPSFGSPTPSSRPLSKVRTNFVAVEKDGRIGLRREPSRDSVSVSSRRFSNETESTTPAPIPESDDVFSESIAMDATVFKTNLAKEPIPESPSQGPATHASTKRTVTPQKSAETPDITPCPNPDKIVDEEETKTRLTSADPTLKEPAVGKPAALNGTAGSANKTKSPTNGSNGPAKLATPISTSIKTTTKPLKSPLAAKAPKSPAKDTAKPPAKVSEKKLSSATHKDVVPKPTAPKAAVLAKKAAPPELAPSGGSVKPKPKSPTRPAKLPSSLTAPTAASASKLSGGVAPPGQSLSRASGNVSPATTHKATSGAGAPNPTTTSTGKTLRRQASTISRSRPSLGPPPKLPAKDHPPVRKDGHVDEGFLARMMRPTQASSSKTNDKSPVTPPRKQTAPTTIKKSSGKDIDGGARKRAVKMTEPLKKDNAVKKPVSAKAETKKPVRLDTATAAGSFTETASVAPEAHGNESATAARAVKSTVGSVESNLGTVVDAERSTTPTEPVPQMETEAGQEADWEHSVHDSNEPMMSEEPSTAESPMVAEPATEKTSVDQKKPTPVEEPSAATEPVTVNEPETFGKVEASDVQSLSSTAAFAPAENVDVQTQQPSVPQEEKAVSSTAIKTALAALAEPEKVADIEDVVGEPSAQPGVDSAL